MLMQSPLVETVETACDLCGSRDRAPFATGYDHEYTAGPVQSFDFVKCRQCGLVYLNPRPSISEFKKIYPENYHSYHYVTKKSALSGLASRFGSNTIARDAYMARAKQGPLRVLDIGCGNGPKLDMFRQLDTSIETHGLESDPKAVAWARSNGHHVHQGLYEDFDPTGLRFDIIIASHVIEHVASPSAFMAKTRELLADSGCFVCETPNIDTVELALLRRNGNWGGFHTPRHWNFFDEQTFRALAAKTGLRVKELTYRPVPAFWIWTFHKMLQDCFGGKLKPLADRLMPVSHHHLYATALAAGFSMLDLTIRACTGKCSGLRAILTKE